MMNAMRSVAVALELTRPALRASHRMMSHLTACSRGRAGRGGARQAWVPRVAPVRAAARAGRPTDHRVRRRQADAALAEGLRRGLRGAVSARGQPA
eukprot:2159504-Prymnesium_polylepis.2